MGQGDISAQLLENLQRKQAMTELALLSEGRFHRESVADITLSPNRTIEVPTSMSGTYYTTT